jgi:hypothetical protein
MNAERLYKQSIFYSLMKMSSVDNSFAFSQNSSLLFLKTYFTDLTLAWLSLRSQKPINLNKSLYILSPAPGS